MILRSYAYGWLLAASLVRAGSYRVEDSSSRLRYVGTWTKAAADFFSDGAVMWASDPDAAVLFGPVYNGAAAAALDVH